MRDYIVVSAGRDWGIWLVRWSRRVRWGETDSSRSAAAASPACSASLSLTSSLLSSSNCPAQDKYSPALGAWNKILIKGSQHYWGWSREFLNLLSFLLLCKVSEYKVLFVGKAKYFFLVHLQLQPQGHSYFRELLTHIVILKKIFLFILHRWWWGCSGRLGSSSATRTPAVPCRTRSKKQKIEKEKNTLTSCSFTLMWSVGSRSMQAKNYWP